MNREGRKWHRQKNKELKRMIKRARKEKMHPSFINLLKAQDKVKEKYKCKMEFYEGATEAEIQEFENRMGVTLPESYRDFLKFTDGANLGEGNVTLRGVHERKIIGNIEDLNYFEPDADWYNIAEAKKHNLLILGDDIANYLIGVNLENGEIALWDCEDVGNEYCELSPDFYSYIESVAEEIKNKERDDYYD